MSRSIAREEELYTLWESRAAPGVQMRALGGERIVVISPGARNDGSGPDYLDAVLLINAELRVGPVEMHRSEGEWFTHGHQHDPAYSGVILHVLAESPGVTRLPIPTIDATALLEGIDADGAAGSIDASFAPGDLPASLDDAGASLDEARTSLDDASSAGSDLSDLITPDLLADLAWGRLLRRVTEIVRSEHEAPARDRLRRAFIRRMFDALGYAANRAPMGEVARRLLARERELMRLGFDEMAAEIFKASGLERRKIIAAGQSFMSESRLRNILENCDLPPQVADWRYDTRPANAPERRLWGAAKLVFDIYQNDLLGQLYEAVATRRFNAAAAPIVVRRNGSTFVGASRAAEIVVNALLPVVLAAGIMIRDRSLIEGAAALYRGAPSQGTNRLVRRVEERFLARGRLEGGFWQQGAIELHQRYLLPDRSGLSFVAEVGPAAARSMT